CPAAARSTRVRWACATSVHPLLAKLSAYSTETAEQRTATSCPTDDRPTSGESLGRQRCERGGSTSRRPYRLDNTRRASPTASRESLTSRSGAPFVLESPGGSFPGNSGRRSTGERRTAL